MVHDEGRSQPGQAQPLSRTRRAVRPAPEGTRSACPTSITADSGPNSTRRTLASHARRCIVAAGTTPANSRSPRARREALHRPDRGRELQMGAARTAPVAKPWSSECRASSTSPSARRRARGRSSSTPERRLSGSSATRRAAPPTASRRPRRVGRPSSHLVNSRYRESTTLTCSASTDAASSACRACVQSKPKRPTRVLESEFEQGTLGQSSPGALERSPGPCEQGSCTSPVGRHSPESLTCGLAILGRAQRRGLDTYRCRGSLAQLTATDL